MMNKEKIIKKLSLGKEGLKKKYGLKNMALFGSFARDEQTASSDVDIVVEVDPSIGLNFISLADEIEKTVGLPTDVVSMNGIKPQYLNEIKKDLIYV